MRRIGGNRCTRRLLCLWPKVRPLLDFPKPIEEDENLPVAPVKLAAAHGVGVGTVQRIKAALAA